MSPLEVVPIAREEGGLLVDQLDSLKHKINQLFKELEEAKTDDNHFLCGVLRDSIRMEEMSYRVCLFDGVDMLLDRIRDEFQEHPFSDNAKGEINELRYLLENKGFENPRKQAVKHLTDQGGDNVTGIHNSIG